jgi:S-adenosylmethionine/arginine decarboxylase-like enzyme
MKDNKRYGIEIIVDLHDCDIKRFTKKSLDEFFLKLCELSDMTPVGKPKYWHELSNIPHLKGYSGIQFIKTSNILIHTLDITKDAYINFFSCKDFDPNEILDFIIEHFRANRVYSRVIYRGEYS